MDGFGDFIKKISAGITSFADLLDKSDFKDQLRKAGTVGALINLGLKIYTKVKDDLQTDEEHAFYSFYKVAFESAKESIPAEDRERISIKDVKSEDTKQELFQTFTKIKWDQWNGYLPDHPTIIQFRTLICDILRKAQYNNLVQNNNLISDFIFKFNTTLEDKADNDPDFKPFKTWFTLIERTRNLMRHLEYSRSLIYKIDPIDQKPLEEYYVENNALLTDRENLGKGRWLFSVSGSIRISFLDEKKWYAVIGAPFGIGKTFFAIYLTSNFASKYLNDPEHKYNYIPIFVPKREVINVIGQQRIFLKTVILIFTRMGLIKVRYCDIRRRVFLKIYYNLALKSGLPHPGAFYLGWTEKSYLQYLYNTTNQ